MGTHKSNWQEITGSTEAGDRTKWILRLLYAPDKQGDSKPIYGRTRLMKACFLLDRKLEEEFRIETDFEFTEGKFGPFDKGVYVAVEYLEQNGFVDIREKQDDDGNETQGFYLSERGEEQAERLFTELDSDLRNMVAWIKYRHAMRPLGQLLNFVYNQYPNMTTESVL